MIVDMKTHTVNQSIYIHSFLCPQITLIYT